jgi:type II secretory pathway component PulK
MDSPRNDFVLRVAAVDECGKVNVNTAPEPLLAALAHEAGFGYAADLAAAIVDWRDADGSGVAERDLYAGLTGHYVPPNADLAWTDELLFVFGVTPQTYFGEDANHNRQLDAEEDDGDTLCPRDNAEGTLQLGLADLLTVHGDGVVNINTAPEHVLRACLDLVLDSTQSQDLMGKILLRRRGPDRLDGTDDDAAFQSDDEIIQLLGLPCWEKLMVGGVEFGVNSSVFRFYLQVELPAAHVTMTSEVLVARLENELKAMKWQDNF